MKITRIRLFAADLPYVGGAYRWGRGNAIEVARSSVIVIDTDAGLSGCGEFCPCGENYIEAYSRGVAGAAELLAPALLGEDPRQVGRIEWIMDQVIRGHGYAKAPIDAACWDILGKATGQPVWMLLGGKLSERVPLYRVAPQGTPEAMASEMAVYRAEGYSQFQIKVGADWAGDIERIEATVACLEAGEKAFADANQGWRVDEALRVARATRHLDYFFEQPCQSYEECQQVRRRTDLPMKLDECISDMRDAHRLVEDKGAEIVCLKLSKQGGLSKTRRMRDYLLEHRIPVVAEDTWGGEITTATLLHLAASTPPDMLINTTDLHNYNTTSTGRPGPKKEAGHLIPGEAPGLGVEPDFASLGAPIAVFGSAPS